MVRTLVRCNDSKICSKGNYSSKHVVAAFVIPAINNCGRELNTFIIPECLLVY
jgi:hypothetical protein